RGWWLQIVHDWLMPWMNRQQAFNARLAAAFEALIAQERERAFRFERFESTLIVFLQHITAFVETKDRQLAAGARHEFEGHQRQLEELKQQLRDNLPDLHAQVAVLQRTAHMLTRDLRE